MLYPHDFPLCFIPTTARVHHHRFDSLSTHDPRHGVSIANPSKIAAGGRTRTTSRKFQKENVLRIFLMRTRPSVYSRQFATQSQRHQFHCAWYSFRSDSPEFHRHGTIRSNRHWAPPAAWKMSSEPEARSSSKKRGLCIRQACFGSLSPSSVRGSLQHGATLAIAWSGCIEARRHPGNHDQRSWWKKSTAIDSR